LLLFATKPQHSTPHQYTHTRRQIHIALLPYHSLSFSSSAASLTLLLVYSVVVQLVSGSTHAACFLFQTRHPPCLFRTSVCGWPNWPTSLQNDTLFQPPHTTSPIVPIVPTLPRVIAQ
jgi:hypothetical protein